jgi:hypothetical protein
LASAQERQVSATKALERAQRVDPKDLANADLDRREALLGVDDALDRVEDAQKALAAAQADGDQEAIGDATRDLASANLSLERAQMAATAAAQAQNDLDPNSEAGAQRVADAQRDLEDANNDVATAYLGVRDASQELATVQAGDPERANKIRDAYKDLVTAQNNVKDAKYNELDAILDLEDARYREAALLGASGDAADRLNVKLREIAAAYPQLAPLLGGLIGTTGGNGAPTSFDLTRGSNGPGSAVSGRRATGGPVAAGGAYIVGENGPEMLQIGRVGGTVIPNGGLGGMNVVINMPPGSNGEDVVAAIKRYEQRNGRGWRN